MKQDNELTIPVGVSLTHDGGKPVIFAYVGGKGPLGMRAKRFNPRVLGSLERALKQAIRWRKQALREHTAAVAALAALPKREAAARLRKHRKKLTARQTARRNAPRTPAASARSQGRL